MYLLKKHIKITLLCLLTLCAPMLHGQTPLEKAIEQNDSKRMEQLLKTTKITSDEKMRLLEQCDKRLPVLFKNAEFSLKGIVKESAVPTIMCMASQWLLNQIYIYHLGSVYFSGLFSKYPNLENYKYEKPHQAVIYGTAQCLRAWSIYKLILGLRQNAAQKKLRNALIIRSIIFNTSVAI